MSTAAPSSKKGVHTRLIRANKVPPPRDASLGYGDGATLFPSNRLVCRTALVLWRMLLDIKMSGVDRLPRTGPMILVANHPTYLDPAILMTMMPRKARFVAWDKLWTLPPLRWFLSRFQAIPVGDRQASMAMMKECRKALKEGDLVGIFPEGGRSPANNEIGPFLPGAARLSPDGKTPMIPVAIHCHRRVWPVGRPYPLPGPYRIEFGDPVTPGQRTPDELLQELRQWIVDRVRAGFPLDRR